MAVSSLKVRVTNAISAARNGSKAQHELLVDLLRHAEQHGDYTELARLVAGLADTGYRIKALVAWVSAHSPINFGEDENGAVTASIPKKAERRRPYLIAEAAEVPYWRFTAENAPKPIDMVKLIMSLAKKAQSDGEKVEATPEALAAAIAELTAAVSA
jgi:hypothetical protein